MRVDFQFFFPYFGVFFKFCSAFLVAPCFLEESFPFRMRILLALSTALLMTPLVAHLIPHQLSQAEAILFLGKESLIGFFLGFFTRIFLVIADYVGHAISNTSSLSNAFILSPDSHTQDPILVVKMRTLFTAILFASDFHHLIIRALFKTYDLDLYHENYFSNDLIKIIIHSIQHIFMCVVQFSIPFIVIGVITQLAVGFLNRIAPQIQVFYLLMPIQIILGQIIFCLCIGTLLKACMNACVIPFLNN
jgi:flagellar biosynthetic protein FliR